MHHTILNFQILNIKLITHEDDSKTWINKSVAVVPKNLQRVGELNNCKKWQI